MLARSHANTDADAYRNCHPYLDIDSHGNKDLDPNKYGDPHQYPTAS